MPSPSRRAFLARTAAACAAAAAAGVPILRPAFAQDALAVNIACIPSDIAGSAYYASDNGFFKKSGVNASFLGITNGAAITAAVLGGSADIGYSNVISLLLAHSRGLPITILFPANLHSHEAPTAGLMSVNKSSPIMSARDFNGKTIAVTGINNISDIAAREWIDKNGGDSKTVKSVELPLPEMKAALDSGRIDGANLDTTSDPTLNKAGDSLRFIGSTFDAVSQHFAPSVWFSTNDWVAKHPAAAKAFVAGMRESAVWAGTHHRESADILSKYTHVTPAQINQVTRVTYGEHLTPDLIQPNMDVAVKYGVLKAAFPISDMISSTAG
jgi:NitT/TauT family transport system substrate-binding protein